MNSPFLGLEEAEGRQSDEEEKKRKS